MNWKCPYNNADEAAPSVLCKGSTTIGIKNCVRILRFMGLRFLKNIMMISLHVIDYGGEVRHVAFSTINSILQAVPL